MTVEQLADAAATRERAVVVLERAERDLRAAVCAARADGASLRAIARVIGVSQETVRTWTRAEPAS